MSTLIHLPENIYLDDVSQIIDMYSDKAVFLKDIHSRYEDCNEFYSQKYNFNDVEEIIGLTDPNLNPKYNELYIKDDQYVINSMQTKNFYNPAYYPSDGKVFVEGILRPVFNRKSKVVGIVGIMDVKEHILAGTFISVLNYIRHNNIANHLEPKKYLLNKKMGMSISKKELVCYFYSELINLSAKQISALMNLSSRTVEKYIERVREKQEYTPTDIFNQTIQALILQNLG